MADEFLLKLEGVDELKRTLKDLPKKIRERAVRSALRRAGQVISKDAKARAPVLSFAGAMKQNRWFRTRTPGTVKKRISVRNSKFARQAGDEGVFIGVRPLRGRAQTKRFGKAGARNPNDPFYWRFLEFGTSKMRARPFLAPAAASKGRQAIDTFLRDVAPAIERMNKKGGG